MTEAGWTREKPTKEGHYWYRSINDKQTESVVWVAPNMGVFSAFYHSRVEHLDGEWLGPITPDSFQQGRVASLVAMKDYLETRADIVEGAALRELLAGNSVKESNERSALAEIHAMQSVIRDLEAQQAQGGVGDDLFILP